MVLKLESNILNVTWKLVLLMFVLTSFFPLSLIPTTEGVMGREKPAEKVQHFCILPNILVS